MEKDENLMIARHSMAHVLAKAIVSLYPSTRLTIGPAIEDGFYYDIDLDENLSPSDYSKIEKKMQEILNKGEEFKKEVVSKENLSYIMGNPPFVGARLMDENQKEDILNIFGNKWKNAGNLDYVACWYKKASDYIINTNIRVALVSTNSICQGEQVVNLWKNIFAKNIEIIFSM